MLEVIEKDYAIDGQDVRVIFEPQEVVESDASDFSEDMDGLLGSYALFSIKNDQTVIGDIDLFACFNTDTVDILPSLTEGDFRYRLNLSQSQ